MSLHYHKLRNGSTILRLIAIGMSLVALILFIRAYMLEQYIYSDGLGSFFAMLPMSALSFSIVWCIASLIATLKWGSYHPAIDVSFELIAMCVTWSFAATSMAWAAYGLSTREYCYERCDIDLLAAQLECAGSALTLTVGIYHLYALVLGCKATHLLRQKKKQELFIQLNDIDAGDKA